MSQIFGQLVIGPPGSGKTTYCNEMGKFLESLGRKVAIINIGKYIYIFFFFQNFQILGKFRN